ncbi:SMP-30/gluconolactonase/LRE family protein [Arthrobacter nitrophenolicus]|uniref:SMP-30/gluconolactonase/LRE family protein n=1 Tax=Arthrobacter nitrophenolicus TaxID=683150 RepID=A0A4R5Y532_9MICC|nr:SMP-30/gluconolactonase/LRE family protein [Arthrobacter nitrophenolicus]TDL39680.1 SMP-30/gluconolactonase/LRE family protein [Arthrobacter nitrophenolicus]
MEFHTAATGVGFTEGPVYTQRGTLVFVSVDQGLVYETTDGITKTLARTGGGPNGAAEGPDGIIYVAQNGGQWPGRRSKGVSGGVQAIHPDGTVVTLTSDPIYPNDLCFGPDGYLYVTDPSRGPARDDGRLWRIDAKTGEAELLLSVGWYPNGIGFSTDDDSIFVAQGGEGRILRFPFAPAERLGKPELHVQLDHGRPDGFAWDVAGNLVIGAITGVAPGDLQVYNPEGNLMEIISLGEGQKYTNVAISSTRTLAVTDSDNGQVLETNWPSAGLPLHPFRYSSRTNQGAPEGGKG